MIDIKLLRQKPEFFRKATKDKGYSDAVVDEVLFVDAQLRQLISREDNIRSERNLANESEKERGVQIKNELKQISEERQRIEETLNEKLALIPNPALDMVPVGRGEDQNVVLRKWGTPRDFSFEPKNHLELGEDLGIINFNDGGKVAGSQFYFLDNEGAFLELALVQFSLNTLKRFGFVPTLTPDLARSEYYLGTGYMPKGDEAQTYTLENDDLGLIATAEVTLAARHAKEVINEQRLPIKYAGVSHCFRKEAGAHGKYSKGLYRVHQFTKVEMFVYANPDESKKIHEELLSFEEQIWQQLEIPYQVLEICTGDLGAIAARKFDIEAWMPGRNTYGEVTSTSNCTDFQSRNLDIRVKGKDKGTYYAHLLNGTAVAVSRAIIAILENHQNQDGSVNIPQALIPYMGGIEKIEKK